MKPPSVGTVRAKPARREQSVGRASTSVDRRTEPQRRGFQTAHKAISSDMRRTKQRMNQPVRFRPDAKLDTSQIRDLRGLGGGMGILKAPPGGRSRIDNGMALASGRPSAGKRKPMRRISKPSYSRPQSLTNQGLNAIKMGSIIAASASRSGVPLPLPIRLAALGSGYLLDMAQRGLMTKKIGRVAKTRTYIDHSF